MIPKRQETEDSSQDLQSPKLKCGFLVILIFQREGSARFFYLHPLKGMFNSPWIDFRSPKRLKGPAVQIKPPMSLILFLVHIFLIWKIPGKGLGPNQINSSSMTQSLYKEFFATSSLPNNSAASRSRAGSCSLCGLRPTLSLSPAVHACPSFSAVVARNLLWI